MSDDSRMHRMQFYITPELRTELNSMATRRDTSMAELIREAITSYVQRETSTQKSDPALDIIGMIEWPDAPSQAAVNHDHYVYRKDWDR